MARTDVEEWLVVDRPRWWRTYPAFPADALARLKSTLGRGRSGVRTVVNDAELDESRRQDRGR